MKHLITLRYGEVTTMCGAPAKREELVSVLKDCDCITCKVEDNMDYELYLLKNKRKRALTPKGN